MGYKDDIKIGMGLDSSRFDAGLARAQGGISKFATSAIKAIAPVAGITGLMSVTRSAISLGSQISDLAVQLNIGTTELQALQFAAQEAGVKSATLERALRNVQLRAQAAADGNKAYSDALNRLGLDVSSFLKLNTSEKFEAIAKAQKAATNQAEAFRDVATIIGERAGPELQEVLQKLSSEGFASVETAAKKAGQVMSEDTIKKLDAASDAIDRMKKRMTILAGEVIPPVLKLMDVFNIVVAQGGSQIASATMMVRDFAMVIAKNLGAVLSPAIHSMESLGLAFKALGQAAIRDFEGAGETMKRSLDVGVQAGKDLIDIPKKLKENFVEFGASVGQNVKYAFDSTVDNAINAAGVIKSVFVETEDTKRKESDKTTAVVIENDEKINRINQVKAMLAQAQLSGNAAMVDHWQKELKALTASKELNEEIAKTKEKVLNTTAQQVSAEVAAAQAAEARMGLEFQINNLKENQQKFVDRVQVGSKGNFESLSTEKLEYLLQDTKQQLFDLGVRVGFQSDAYAFASLSMQRDEARISEELNLRRQYSGTPDSVKNLLFDPFQQERLDRYVKEQTDMERQSRSLENLSRDMSDIRSTIIKLDKGLN